MGMIGYRPPFTKLPASPYGNMPPADPFSVSSEPGIPNGIFANAPQSVAPTLLQNGSPLAGLTAAPKIKRPFFTDDGEGTGNRIAGVLGDVLSQFGGGQPTYLPMMMQRQQDLREDARWQSRWKMQRDAEQADREAQRNAPQYFSGHEDRVRFDPTTNTSSTVYDAPTDAETYARSQGFTAGTPDYNTALQDFTLRGNGPSAYDFRTGLEGTRANNRSTLQDRRFNNQASLRKLPTYRDTHPPAPRLGGLRRAPAGSGAGAGPTEGQSATGPGGHKIVVRGGRWVDAQSGRPVG